MLQARRGAPRPPFRCKTLLAGWAVASKHALACPYACACITHKHNTTKINDQYILNPIDLLYELVGEAGSESRPAVSFAFELLVKSLR